jgi:hypothetical protein
VLKGSAFAKKSIDWENLTRCQLLNTNAVHALEYIQLKKKKFRKRVSKCNYLNLKCIDQIDIFEKENWNSSNLTN